MVEKKVKIEIPTGLHARPANQLCSTAKKFDCKITLIYETKFVDSKSILSIMAAGIRANSEVVIRCDGEDEIHALETISNLAASLRD